MKRKAAYLLLPPAVLCLYIIATPQRDDKPADSTADTQDERAKPVFYWTTPGLEPDKCVAAWLLTRYVTPGSRVVFTEASSNGVPFDVPGCELQRQLGQATSNLVLQRYGIADPFAARVVAVVREIELMPWSMNDEPFFLEVRTGLAEAVNSSDVDDDCLAEAVAFLDDLRARHAAPSVP